MTSEKPVIRVVDDDQGTRDTIRLLFEFAGYPVFEAANGYSALHLLSISRSRFVVLLDWLLPDLDGIQVIQQHALAAAAPGTVQRSRPHPHAFILLTASNKGIADLPPGMLVSVVRKPFDMAYLLGLVKVAAEGRAGAEDKGKASGA